LPIEHRFFTVEQSGETYRELPSPDPFGTIE